VRCGRLRPRDGRHRRHRRGLSSCSSVRRTVRSSRTTTNAGRTRRPARRGGQRPQVHLSAPCSSQREYRHGARQPLRLRDTSPEPPRHPTRSSSAIVRAQDIDHGMPCPATGEDACSGEGGHEDELRETSRAGAASTAVVRLRVGSPNSIAHMQPEPSTLRRPELIENGAVSRDSRSPAAPTSTTVDRRAAQRRERPQSPARSARKVEP